MPLLPAEAAFPIMRRCLAEAQQIADDELRSDVHLRDDDHLGFMALCFTHKQLTHARSVALLLDASQPIDATTIARTMLEGLILVAWAALAPDERPLRWRAYSLVSDWKILLAAESSGKPTPDGYRDELMVRLREFDEFLTGKARKHGTSQHLDPYQSTWRVNADGSKVELKDMVVEIGDPNMKGLYDELSQVGHWTPRGVAVNFSRADGRTQIGFTNANLAAMSCAVAFQSLTQTALLLARHCTGHPLERMQAIVDEYVAKLSNA